MLISLYLIRLQRYLSLRSTQGELIFNQDEKTLTISVIPRDVDTVTKAGDIKSLSGGERSYVTVSFLMSLWKCVDHPFFFLDEYDVFTVSERHAVSTNSFN